MDTKERRAPARRKRPAQASRTAPPKRRPANTKPKPAPDRRKRRPTPSAPKRPQSQKRRIRAPRESIPEAVYTMPQPMGRGKFLLRLASVAAVVIAVMMAVSIFFRVDTITVLGAEKYTAWMVSEASGIQEGDGLLTLSKARAAGKIQSALPYVDEVKITRQLPGTVCIEIKELDVTYAICAEDNTWWLISSSGEVIEKIDASAASGYTRIFGVQAQAPREDQQVTAAEDVAATETTQAAEATAETQEGEENTEAVTIPTQTPVTNAQRLDAALSILKALENNGVIGEVASINVENLTDIQLQYGQRFQVQLGNADRLDYKISYMAQAVAQMEDYQAGVLDVSFALSDQGIFTPES